MISTLSFSIIRLIKTFQNLSIYDSSNYDELEITLFSSKILSQEQKTTLMIMYNLFLTSRAEQLLFRCTELSRPESFTNRKFQIHIVCQFD